MKQTPDNGARLEGPSYLHPEFRRQRGAAAVRRLEVYAAACIVVSNQTLNTTQPTKVTTDRPAPFLPGLYSLQAVTANDHAPDVTVYRMREQDAEKWKKHIVSGGGKFSGYLLRRNVASWRTYDSSGVFAGASGDVAVDHVGESSVRVDVDKDMLLDEARKTTGNPGLTMIVSAECHTDAAAADHSNFTIMCRRMLLEARPDDLRHCWLLDSRKWNCRVTGLFADVSNLSPGMQDVFLERFKWLRQGWPLVAHHHHDTLASRLAKTRAGYVADVLHDCCRMSGMSGDLANGLLAAWSLASPGSKYSFARHMVEHLHEGLLYAPGKGETFDADIIAEKAASVVRPWRDILR